jgi:hypothetical protein
MRLDPRLSVSPSTPDHGHGGSLLATAISRRTLLDGASRIGLLAAFGTVASACATPTPGATTLAAAPASEAVGVGEAWDDGTFWDDGTGWVA